MMKGGVVAIRSSAVLSLAHACFYSYTSGFALTGQLLNWATRPGTRASGLVVYIFGAMARPATVLEYYLFIFEIVTL